MGYSSWGEGDIVVLAVMISNARSYLAESLGLIQ
jgi:hypothetical protein